MNTSFTLHKKEKAKLCWESVTEESRAQQDKTHSGRRWDWFNWKPCAWDATQWQQETREQFLSWAPWTGDTAARHGPDLEGISADINETMGDGVKHKHLQSINKTTEMGKTDSLPPTSPAAGLQLGAMAGRTRIPL